MPLLSGCLEQGVAQKMLLELWQIGFKFFVLQCATIQMMHVVMAILCLHNLLRSDTIGRALYTPPDMIDHEDEIIVRIRSRKWRQESVFEGFLPLSNLGGNRHANDALNLRDEWCAYFSGVGAVSLGRTE